MGNLRGGLDGRGRGNPVEESPDSKKKRCRVTLGQGNLTDSATENRLPVAPKVDFRRKPGTNRGGLWTGEGETVG
ncbi:hypothetical protein IMCC21224_112720 [Puniceibacterium sp. IMCC21224]|nr:hypothetical protein IMCC21224_112720 [Puniceibacterium sp. IMCC21224]